MKTTPSYYVGRHQKIEAMDVISDFGLNYNIGTAVTYLLRAGKKPDNPMEQDIRKAIAHLIAELKFIEFNTEAE